MRSQGVSPYQLPPPLTPADRQRIVVMLPPSPYERGPVLRVLHNLNETAGPVMSGMLADHVGIPDRTARLYLKRLENAGLVQRPDGPRSGWLAIWG